MFWYENIKNEGKTWKSKVIIIMGLQLMLKTLFTATSTTPVSTVYVSR